MWKVVGFNVRDRNGRYYDLYLQREATAPAQGIEVMKVNFSASKISYVPVIGDWVLVSLDSFNGRRYATEIVEVK